MGLTRNGSLEVLLGGLDRAHRFEQFFGMDCFGLRCGLEKAANILETLVICLFGKGSILTVCLVISPAYASIAFSMVAVVITVARGSHQGIHSG